MTTQNKNNHLHNQSIMIQDITNLHTPVKDIQSHNMLIFMLHLHNKTETTLNKGSITSVFITDFEQQ